MVNRNRRRRLMQRQLARRPVLPAHNPGGYQGLEGVLAALQGGVSAKQLSRMEQGRTGGSGWGGIGGMRGRLSGLSPYAVNFLATSGILEKQAPTLQSLTKEIDSDGDGVMETVDLEGDELWKTTLMNNLLTQNADQNPRYQLRGGVDAAFLGQLFSQGFGGHSAYERGYGASGRTRATDQPYLPFRPKRRRGQTPPIGRRHRIYGR